MRARNRNRGATPGFLFLFALLLYLDTSGMVLLGLFACILHEAGHWVALSCTGNGVRGFCLTLFGAKMEPEAPMGLLQEFVAAAAGPAVNLALAVMFSRLPGGSAFAGINLALGTFNLLPVGELDGGRMVRCILFLWLQDEPARRILRCLEFCFTAIFFCLGVWFSMRYGNLSLLLMSLWLVIGHREEKTSDFQKKNGKRGCQTVRKRLK